VFTAGDQEPGLAPGPLAAGYRCGGRGPEGRFWGALLTIKNAQARLPANGSITVTDALLADTPIKGLRLATAFGGAIEHLVRGLAVDLAPIRVNSVCRGLVLTE
jgi:NAD(P)-dependent dehydrogenase (short-subunit alcohol dehydrogenase family)